MVWYNKKDFQIDADLLSLDGSFQIDDDWTNLEKGFLIDIDLTNSKEDFQTGADETNSDFPVLVRSHLAHAESNSCWSYQLQQCSHQDWRMLGLLIRDHGNVQLEFD